MNQMWSKSSLEAEHLEGYFPSMYLTVIALGQGIVVALLATHFFNSSPSVLHCWPKYAISLVVIITIWHHYMIGSIFTRWFPDLRDSLLPIALVGGEVFMMGTIRKELPVALWANSFWVISFIGCLAYANAGFRCDPILFSRLSSDKSKQHCLNIKIAHVYYAATLCGLIGLSTLFLKMTNKIPEWYPKLILILLICHIVIFEFFYIWLIKPFFRKALRSFKGCQTKNSRSFF